MKNTKRMDEIEEKYKAANAGILTAKEVMRDA
jgi:hypothetical protein